MIEKVLHLLPIIIIVESYLASIPYAFTGRYGSALYWFSAGTINVAAVFLIRKYG